MRVTLETYLVELFNKDKKAKAKFEKEFKRKKQLLEKIESTYVELITNSLDHLLDKIVYAISSPEKKYGSNKVQNILIKGSKNERRILYKEHQKSVDIVFSVIKKDLNKQIPKVKRIWKIYSDALNIFFEFVMENKDLIKSYKKNKKFYPIEDIRLYRDRYNGIKEYSEVSNSKIVDLLTNYKAFTGQAIKNIMPGVSKMMTPKDYNRAIMQQDTESTLQKLMNMD